MKKNQKTNVKSEKKTLKIKVFSSKEMINEMGIKAMDLMAGILEDAVMEELRKNNRRIKNCVNAVSLAATVKTAKINRK